MLPSTATVASRSPLGDAARGAVEAADRARDLLGDQSAGDDPEQQHDPREGGEVEDRGPHRAVHRVDALGDPDRADRPAALEDRDRGGEDFGAEGLAVAGDLLAAARERRLTSGPVGVAAARRRRRPSRRAARRRRRRRSPGRGRFRRRRRRGAAAAAGAAGRPARRRVAATTSAWLRAWPRTSESTRSRRLSASGTPSAISASSRT